MESTSFSPGHDYVCQRLTPEHRIYYFVLGNSGELRYRNPKASPAMTPDSNRSQLYGSGVAGDKLYFQTVSRTGRVVDSGEWTGLKGAPDYS
jgi:hypothetical protein